MLRSNTSRRPNPSWIRQSVSATPAPPAMLAPTSTLPSKCCAATRLVVRRVGPGGTQCSVRSDHDLARDVGEPFGRNDLDRRLPERIAPGSGHDELVASELGVAFPLDPERPEVCAVVRRARRWLGRAVAPCERADVLVLAIALGGVGVQREKGQAQRRRERLRRAGVHLVGSVRGAADDPLGSLTRPRSSCAIPPPAQWAPGRPSAVLRCGVSVATLICPLVVTLRV